MSVVDAAFQRGVQCFFSVGTAFEDRQTRRLVLAALQPLHAGQPLRAMGVGVHHQWEGDTGGGDGGAAH
eukprot:scaffold47_cov258-Pinguiococcus_pyrenoidosus.AAC.10